MTKLILPGTAAASDVVAGKTFSAGTLYNANGSIIERPAQQAAVSMGANGSNLYVRIPTGAYRTPANGANAEIVIPYSMIASNEGTTIKPADIKSTANYYGVQGTLAERLYASGTGTSDNSSFTTHTAINGGTPSYITCSITGLSFSPNIVLVRTTGGGSVWNSTLLFNLWGYGVSAVVKDEDNDAYIVTQNANGSAKINLTQSSCVFPLYTASGYPFTWEAWG
ncbi:hypothetical protein [Paenibacillus sp. 22594]|uniref:hypothetical protein n=1 Tax=Paenibacillus sp. 22594 TaxID=3453947 RepID=UPI003F836505